MGGCSLDGERRAAQIRVLLDVALKMSANIHS